MNNGLLKKAIAFSIFLVLITCGAFAQISFSGLVGAGATLLQGTLDEGDSFFTNSFLMGRLQVRGQNGDGTFGGSLRVMAGGGSIDPVATAWWQPNQYIRVQLGFVDAFAVNEIVGWGYNANDAEEYMSAAGYNYTGNIFPRSTGFYVGSYGNGAALSITPVNWLAFNFLVPYRLATTRYEDVYLYSHAQTVFTFGDVGRLALSFTGAGNGKLQVYGPAEAPLDYDEVLSRAPTAYASFLLTANDYFDLNIGGAYTLPATEEARRITYHSPAAAGFGFSFTYGRFGLKSRIAATFMGSIRANGRRTVNEPLKIAFGILPSFDFTVFKFFLNAGASFKAEEEIMDYNGYVSKSKGSSVLGWHVNPYLTKTVGSGTFYAGVRIETDGIKYASGSRDTIDLEYGKPYIHWGIPIGIQVEL